MENPKFEYPRLDNGTGETWNKYEWSKCQWPKQKLRNLLFLFRILSIQILILFRISYFNIRICWRY